MIIRIVFISALLIILLSCKEKEDLCGNTQNISSLGVPYHINDYEAYISDHKSVDELLCSLKSKYSGKTIILDLWATWCSPCIYDMKESKLLKKDLKDNGIEIISICLNTKSSSQRKWENRLLNLSVDGPHILLNSNLAESLMFYFNRTGLPLYVLIKEDGSYVPNFVKFLKDSSLEEILSIIQN